MHGILSTATQFWKRPKLRTSPLHPLRNVEAVASFYDAPAASLLRIRIIHLIPVYKIRVSPGKRHPLRSWRDRTLQCIGPLLSFKEAGGGTIPFREPEDKTRSRPRPVPSRTPSPTAEDVRKQMGLPKMQQRRAVAGYAHPGGDRHSGRRPDGGNLAPTASALTRPLVLAKHWSAARPKSAPQAIRP